MHGRALRDGGGGATSRRPARAGVAATTRSASPRSYSPIRRASRASETHAPNGGGGRTPQQPPHHRGASREDRPCGMTSTHRRRRRETKVEPVREHGRCFRAALPISIAFESHHPLLSVSRWQSSDGQFIPREAKERRSSVLPMADLPACATRFLSSYGFLLRAGRACAGRAARWASRFGYCSGRACVTPCAAPRRVRGDRGSHRRRRRGRPGAAERRASRARTRARRATSSGSAPLRRLRRRDRLRR